MGIRVHTLVGWGCKNIAKNKDLQLLVENHDMFSGYSTIIKIAEWAQDNSEVVFKYYDKLMYLESSKHLKSFLKSDLEIELRSLANLKGQSISYMSTFGETSRGVVLKPFTSCDWKRYDDIIDYYVFPLKNKFKYLNGGIYPYANVCFCYRNKEENKHLIEGATRLNKSPFLNVGDYNQMIGKWDKKQKPLANEKDYKLYVNDWRIDFPLLLLYPLVYAKYCCNLDIDIENIKNSLRPCLAVYWN